MILSKYSETNFGSHFMEMASNFHFHFLRNKVMLLFNLNITHVQDLQIVPFQLQYSLSSFISDMIMMDL